MTKRRRLGGESSTAAATAGREAAAREARAMWATVATDETAAGRGKVASGAQP